MFLTVFKFKLLKVRIDENLQLKISKSFMNSLQNESDIYSLMKGNIKLYFVNECMYYFEIHFQDRKHVCILRKEIDSSLKNNAIITHFHL